MFRHLDEAARLFRRERGFALAVVLSLALGIGANTAIFSVVNSVLLRPLPYPQPERLVALYEHIPKVADRFPVLPVNLSHFMAWRDRASTLEQVGLLHTTLLNLTGSGEPALLPAATASAGLLEMLGVRPRIGRTFTREEERRGHEVAILTDGLWRKRFGASPDIVGKSLTLDGRPHVVIGVLPPWFRLPRANRVDLLVPIGYTDADLKAAFGDFNWDAVGRLRAGVSRQQALSQLNVIQADIMRGMPDVKMELRALAPPLLDEVVGDSRRGLALVMAAVGAALLVLCVNLANLWLARSASRARDDAIRTALGASRAQLARRALWESLVLALAGGVLGVVVAWWGLGALLRAAPLDLPRLAEIHIDARALAFALLVSAGAGLLFGILPAFGSALSRPQEALKSGGYTSTESRRGVRFRQTLVAVEVGLSAALLIAAGLLMHSFVRLIYVERGFEVERVLAVTVSLPSAKYTKNEQRAQFFDRLLAKASALPGVQSAAIVSFLPLQGETWVDVVGTEHDQRPLLERPAVNVRFISRDYFKLLGVPLREGRLFEEADRGRQVAIVSQGTAARLWPGEHAAGRTMLHNGQPVEVAGVVSDFRSTSLAEDPVLMLYVPYWQQPRWRASLLLRTAMDARATAGAVRAAVWEIDPQVPVPGMRTLLEIMNDSVAGRRFQMFLVMAFAAAALALASLGTYGVLAYSLARRREEIGIRMALGAAAPEVLRMVLLEGMRPAVAGLLAGVGLALAAGGAMRSLLFRVSARDPVTIVVVSVVLVAVSAAACLVPALRATRVDPASVLRAE